MTESNWKDRDHMDALELLKQEHEEMKSLLNRLASEGDTRTKLRLYNEIRSRLTLHEQLEEQLLYPELKGHAETSENAEEGYEEHHVADVVAEEMAGIEAGDAVFDAKAKVLKEILEHHIEEEEREMFPKAKKTLGMQRLKEIGQGMQEMRQGQQAA